MSKIVKVSDSNYKVQVATGGSITFDTTNDSSPPVYGTVFVKGNLDVIGELSYVETTDTQIKDNILELNSGETEVGISLANNYRSGIEINRGPWPGTGKRPPAQFIFDESVTHYDPATGLSAPGSFVVKTKDGILSAIQLASIGTQAGSDIVLDLNETENVVAVARGVASGSGLPYWKRVTDDNHIPNRQFVTEYVASGAYIPGVADVDKLYTGDTGIRAYDSSNSATLVASLSGALISSGNPGTLTYTSSSGDPLVPGMVLSGGGVTSDTYLVEKVGSTWILNQAATGTPTQAIFTEPLSADDPAGSPDTSQIVFTVDNVIQAQLDGNGFYINNIKIKSNTIKNYSVASNLVLTANSDIVQSNAVLQLDNRTQPSYTSGGARIYANTQGPGKTGVFFVNNSNYADELVAKNRALLFSMIF